MKITYDEKHRIFRLDCAGMTYAMSVVDEEGFLGHLWFGAEAGEDDLYAAIDKVEEKLNGELRKRKTKLVDRHRHV